MSEELILTLDTSREGVRIGLLQGEKVLSHVYVAVRGRHASGLVERLENVLALAGKTIHEVRLLVVCIGPGSFTGVRVGMATMQGLAVARDLPLAGVSSLDVLALKGALMGESLTGCRGYLSCIPAGRGMYYCALYKPLPGQEADVDRISDYSCLSVQGINEFVNVRMGFSWDDILLVGDGAADSARELAKAGVQARQLREVHTGIAESVLMARFAFHRGFTGVVEGWSLKPLYIRRPPILKPVDRPRSEKITVHRRRRQKEKR